MNLPGTLGRSMVTATLAGGKGEEEGVEPVEREDVGVEERVELVDQEGEPV